MKFSYELESLYGDYLSVKTDGGIRIDVSFYAGTIEAMYIDENQAWTITDDLLALIDGKPVSLKTIWDEAERQYPAIIAEVEQEQADDEAHEREMSSPEATGRI